MHKFFFRVILYINIYFWMKVLFIFQRKLFLASMAVCSILASKFLLKLVI